MTFNGLNVLAVLAAAISAFVLGGLWYFPLSSARYKRKPMASAAISLPPAAQRSTSSASY